jgi:hypothetical protein
MEHPVSKTTCFLEKNQAKACKTAFQNKYNKIDQKDIKLQILFAAKLKFIIIIRLQTVSVYSRPNLSAFEKR